jgi:hypothetical protein
MNRIIGKLAAAAASITLLAGAGVAAAQPAPPPASGAPVDPARLAKARQLLEMQMGQMNLPGVIRSLDQQMFSQSMAPNRDPAFQKRIMDAVEKVQGQMLPSMMDSMATAFARNLTDKELDDAVAFYSSPSGQSLVRKMPAVMNEVVASIVQWMPRLRTAVIEAACSDNGCTPAQRDALMNPPAAAAPPR